MKEVENDIPNENPFMSRERDAKGTQNTTYCGTTFIKKNSNTYSLENKGSNDKQNEDI